MHAKLKQNVRIFSWNYTSKCPQRVKAKRRWEPPEGHIKQYMTRDTATQSAPPTQRVHPPERPLSFFSKSLAATGKPFRGKTSWWHFGSNHLHHVQLCSSRLELGVDRWSTWRIVRSFFGLGRTASCIKLENGFGKLQNPVTSWFHMFSPNTQQWWSENEPLLNTPS